MVAVLLGDSFRFGHMLNRVLVEMRIDVHNRGVVFDSLGSTLVLGDADEEFLKERRAKSGWKGLRTQNPAS